MPIQLGCPSCQRQLRIPDHLVGHTVKCPGCKKPFQAVVEKASGRGWEEVPLPTDNDDRFHRDEPRPPRRSASARRDFDDDIPNVPVARRRDDNRDIPVARRRDEEDFDDHDDRGSRQRSRRGMYCRTCGYELSRHATVCVDCGVRPLLGNDYCQTCGARTNPAAIVCVECGVALRSGAGGDNRIAASDPPKSPVLMALLSGLCIVGLGQIILGQTAKGISILLGAIVLTVLTGGLSAPIIWVVGAIDAYAIAKKLQEGKTVGQWEFF